MRSAKCSASLHYVTCYLLFPPLRKYGRLRHYYYYDYFSQTTAMFVLLSLLGCCCWATPATRTWGIAPAMLPARR